MSIEIIDADDPDREMLVRFIIETRENHWSPQQIHDFVEWRYFGREHSVPVMAVRDGQCLAFVDSQVRHYFLGANTIPLQESSEWFCMPKYRPIGLGIRVMQKLMERETPIISVRGTVASQQLVQKLGWRKIRPVYLFSKMVNWKSRVRDHWRRLSDTNRGSELTVVNEAPGGEHPPPDDVASDCLKTRLETWEIRWFDAAPDFIGKFHWLRFYLDDSCCGFALVRIYQGAEYRRSQIVHLESTTDDRWTNLAIVEKTSGFLAKSGALRIMARASSPAVCRAYEDAGFVNDGPQPGFLWDRERSLPTDSDTDLSYLRGDDSIRPFSHQANASQTWNE
ncbi:MAG: hypothetical protein KDI68_04720 [Gammaproteobacteria bacterium]|nr:hypothetical protein [Gammaproteobacteria bacterium]